ncbi:MAG: N-acetylneuraminate synthase [Candidatus Omnitrophica bacterium]|nr:N-acetylneuraminate synthase [Candidatus Omnitrophota bacterium]
MTHLIKPVRVAGRAIGPGRPCFVIAEAGVNHNGRLAVAKRLVDAAVGAKVDAVKFQTFTAERLVTATAPAARYQRRARSHSDGESQLEMLKALELSPAAHRTLADYCQRRGIMFLSTPFDEASADLLAALRVPAFKIGSGELTNTPLLRHVARTRRPVILSTGMSSLEEVAGAVETLRTHGTCELVLLHCVSAYPADPADANLRAMDTLRRTFQVPVGYSDHTRGTEVALAAVALGACVIEKHITLDRTLPGPDHQVSLEPHELGALVRAVRIVEQALGHGRKEPAMAEQEVARVARKSLVVAADIPSGSTLTEALIAVKRPGTGIPPTQLSGVVGRQTRRALLAGEVLSWEDVR